MDPRATFFDQHAATWEQRCYPPMVRSRLSGLVERFHLPCGACVLDMGTGTGILHPYLLQGVGAAGKVVAFDLSLCMLQEIRKKPVAANLLCVQATAMALPFQAQRFDQVICFAAFPHFARKQEALQEMARVAKPGAEVIIAHLFSRDQLLNHHKTHSAVAGDSLPDAATMRDLFQAAGFSRPDITDMPGLYLARAFNRQASRDARPASTQLGSPAHHVSEAA